MNLFHHTAIKAHEHGAPLKEIFAAPVRDHIAHAKYLSDAGAGEFDEIASEIETQLVGEGPHGLETAVYAGGER